MFFAVHKCLTVHARMHAPASVYLMIYVGVRHTLHWNALIFSQNNVCLCCGWMLHTEKTPKDRERMHKRQKEWMPFQYSECFQGVALILHIFHTVVLPCAQNKKIRLLLLLLFDTKKTP